MSLLRPISEYAADCWDPYRECQIISLDRVQNKVTKFLHYSERSEWQSLAQRTKLACMCALYKGYTGARTRKAIGVTLQAPNYYSRCNSLKCLFHTIIVHSTGFGRYIHPSSGASNMYNQVWYNLITK